jgi:hypothetical protein
MAIYFNAETEKAIIDYINSDSPEEKNEIYNKKIKYAFNKLVENIIFSFNFKSKFEDYQTLKDKTIGDLILKMNKFNPNINKKAFSFFGTVAKHFIIMELKNENKNVPLVNLDEEHSTPNKQYSTDIILTKFCIYDDDREKQEYKDVILDFLKKEQKKNAFKIDEKILDAIEYAFNAQLDITNKKALFLFLREFTGLPTPEISEFLLRFRPKFKEHMRKYYNGEI